MAFLTDAKLYHNWFRLEQDKITKVWETYPFDVSVGIYGHGNLWSYAWYSDKLINIRPFLPSPTVFLSIDDIKDPLLDSADQKLRASNGTTEGATEGIGAKPLSFRDAIKQSSIYNAAVRHALDLSGSFKFFSLREDAQFVRDKDVFVYVGHASKRAGESLRDLYDIDLMPGSELRRMKKVTN